MTSPDGRTVPTPTNAASSGVEVDRRVLKILMKRTDQDGLAWLVGWLGFLVLGGYGLSISGGSAIFVPLLIAYGSVLATSGYALSHETAHGTAFRTRWLNEACFYLSSYIYFEEPLHRRYSHARHHTYTYHKVLDAQMPQDTPFTLLAWLRDISGITLFLFQGAAFLKCATGRYSDAIRAFTPESELPKLRRNARLYLATYAVTGMAIVAGADFLVWYLVVPRIAGGPVMLLYGMVQHTEMKEEVMDIRESTRSFRTNAFNRFIYMNMNFHVEHHLYPTVPFHALPRLNEEIRQQLPESDPGFLTICWWSLKTATQRSLGRVPNENMGRAIPVKFVGRKPVHQVHGSSS